MCYDIHEKNRMKTQLLPELILFLALWAVLRNAFGSLSTCSASVTPTEMHTHTSNIISFKHATQSVSEVTTSVVAAEFLASMWVVLLYLLNPTQFGPIKVDLLPSTWMPGGSSLLLTSPPASSLLFLCSPWGIKVLRLNCFSGLPRIPNLIK